MIKHTDKVLTAALADWIRANQDDTGCHEAADTLGDLNGVSVLLDLIDGPLTPRCAGQVAGALARHADPYVLPELYRLQGEFSVVYDLLCDAIDRIGDEDELEYEERTCRVCGGPSDDRRHGDSPIRGRGYGCAAGPDAPEAEGTVTKVSPPDGPHLRN